MESTGKVSVLWAEMGFQAFLHKAWLGCRNTGLRRRLPGVPFAEAPLGNGCSALLLL